MQATDKNRLNAITSTSNDYVGIHLLTNRGATKKITYIAIPTTIQDPEDEKATLLLGLNNNNTTMAQPAVIKDAPDLTGNILVLVPVDKAGDWPIKAKETITKAHPLFGKHITDDGEYVFVSLPISMPIVKGTMPIRGTVNESTLSSLENIGEKGLLATWCELAAHYFNKEIHEEAENNRKDHKNHLPPKNRGHHYAVFKTLDGTSTVKSIYFDVHQLEEDDEEAFASHLDKVKKTLAEGTAHNVPVETINTEDSSTVNTSTRIPRKKKSSAQYVGDAAKLNDSSMDLDDATAGKYINLTRYPLNFYAYDMHFYLISPITTSLTPLSPPIYL